MPIPNQNDPMAKDLMGQSPFPTQPKQRLQGFESLDALKNPGKPAEQPQVAPSASAAEVATSPLAPGQSQFPSSPKQRLQQDTFEPLSALKAASEQPPEEAEPGMLSKIWGRMNEPVKMEEVEKIPGLQPDVVADLESKGLDTLSSWFGKEHGEYIKENILHGFTPEVFARGAAKSLTDWYSPVQLAMRGPGMVAAKFAKEAKVAEEAGQGVEAYRLAHKARLAGTIGAAIGVPITAEQTYHLVDNWEEMKPWERLAAVAGLTGGATLAGVGIHAAGGPGAVGETLLDASKKATGVVAKPVAAVSAAVQKAVGVGGDVVDLVYNASKPSRGKAQEYYQTVQAAKPQLVEILKNNPKVSTPQEAYDAIETHREAQERGLRDQARDLQGPDGKPADDAIMHGTEDAVNTALDDYFKEHVGAYKPEEIAKAKEDVINRIRQGEEIEPRDPSLFEGENLRRQLGKETAPVFASDTAIPSAVRDAKIVAAGVLRNQIDAGYEKIGVKGVKEWRQQEAPLIDVRDQLAKAFGKAKEMGDWSLIQAAIRSAGWGGLGMIVGHAPGGLAGEAIGIARDYVRDRFENPNRQIQRAQIAATKEKGPSGAINPTKIPPTVPSVTPPTVAPPIVPGAAGAAAPVPAEAPLETPAETPTATEKPQIGSYSRETEKGLEGAVKRTGLRNDIKRLGDTLPEYKKRLETELAREEAIGRGEEVPAETPKAEVKSPSVLDRLQTKLNKAAEEAHKRIQGKVNDLNVGIDPTMIADMAVIGASKIVNGARTFARFSSEMVSQYGERIKPHLEEIYNAALSKAKNPVDSGRTAVEGSKEIQAAVKNTGLMFIGDDSMGLSHFHDPVTNHTYSLLTDRVSNETLNARMAAKEPPAKTAPLPKQPKLPEEGTYPAIRTDDGGIYFTDKNGETHIQLAKRLGVPAERIIDGGYLKDGVYEESIRSDAGVYGEIARSRQRVNEHFARWGPKAETLQKEAPAVKKEEPKTAKVVEAGTKAVGVAAAIAVGASAVKAQDKKPDKTQLAIKESLRKGETPKEMLQKGNIDVNHRPVIWNTDENPSTIYSTTIPIGKGKWALVPTIVDGKFLTPDGKIPKENDVKAMQALEDKAIEQYKKTGEHLGIFASQHAADKYAEVTHAWMPNGKDEKVYTPFYEGESNMPLSRKEYEDKLSNDSLTKTLTKQKLPDSIEEVVDAQGRRFFKKDGQWVQYTKADQGSTVNTRLTLKGK